MPRKARVHLVPLHTSLVNLPMSMYGPLVERDVRPQSLAVHLKLLVSVQQAPNAEAFVGWTGMGATSSLIHSSKSHTAEISDTVEIDPQYARALGFGQGDIVEIGLLYDLPFAKSVGAEPLTADDWEIIEIHASHTESILLSQVRVAKIGQEIDVWILGKTRVRLRIISLDPFSKSDALLLTTSTEVAITPKLHGQKTFGKSTSETSRKSDSKSYGFLLRVIPRRLAPVTVPEDPGPDIVTYVSPRTFAEFCSPKVVDRCITGSMVKLDPPPDPSLSTQAQAPVADDANLDEQSKDQEGHEEKEKGRRVYINRIQGIVDGQILVPSSYENVEEWDIVCLTISPDDVDSASGPLLPELSTIALPQPEPLQTSLAGVDDIIENCMDFCFRTFMLHSLTDDVKGAPGVLLVGRAGSGKTSIVRAISKALEENQKTLTYIYHVDISRYVQKPVSTLHAMFKYWFKKVAWHRPAVLVLDNLDKLLSAEVEHRDSFRSRQLSELFIHIYSPAARNCAHNFRGILLLATATSKSDLHPAINSSHIFQEVVNLLTPPKQARRDILAKMVNERLRAGQYIREDPESPLNFTALAIQTEGYTPMDLNDLVARAFHQVVIRLSTRTQSQIFLTAADFAAAQDDFVPLSLRDIPLHKSNVTWADIGGLHEVRRVLRETLEWPTKYAPIFAQAPLRLRSGLLLYGYPGCGKTLLASAVAKECGLNFISIKGPEVLNKYIGASEKSVRDLFERATAAKPCVLFFDEGHDSTGVTDRVVNQMLTQMDGAEGLDGVYILAATSRPDLIDSALLRPGRLDKALFCDMPSQEERKEILTALSRKVSISPDVDMDEIAAVTEGYSGADLQALLYNANLEVVHESIGEPSSTGQFTKVEEEPIEYVSFGGPATSTIKSKAEEAQLQNRLRQIRKSLQPSAREESNAKGTKSQKLEIKPEHFHKVLAVTKPSVSLEERRRFDRIYQSFISNRTGNLPVPSESRGVGSRITLA